MKLSDIGTKDETITLYHPELGDIGVELTLCSPFSKEHSQNTARIHPELFGDSSELDTITAWDLAQAESVIKGWSGIEDENGNDLEFSHDECSKIIRNPEYYWIAKQVLDNLAKKKGYLHIITERLKSL